MLLHAIGQAVEEAEQGAALIGWLGEESRDLRLGACYAASSTRWSEELDSALLKACRDRDWDVREAAWPALKAIRRERDVRTLITMLRGEHDLARRWAIFDAALDLGDPGVIPRGASGWLAALCKGVPYAMLKYATDRVKKQRKELEEKLTRESR